MRQNNPVPGFRVSDHRSDGPRWKILGIYFCYRLSDHCKYNLLNRIALFLQECNGFHCYFVVSDFHGC
jgi:hypothetical protein